MLTAGTGTEVLGISAHGWAETGAHARRLSTGTVFDVASLTKVTATLPVVLRLVAGGRVSLSDRVVDALPAFGDRAGERAAVTVEHLLTHTSGLPPDVGYWRDDVDPSTLRARMLVEPLQFSPGERVVYSDIGFLVLGWMAEHVTGRPLDRLVHDGVLEPLGMGRSGFTPRPGDDVAATEIQPDGGYLVGQVHDEKAAALAAPVGHAGLWSTAADLGRYLAAWTGPGDEWLPRSLREAAASDRTPHLTGHRGLGWTAHGDAHDHLGDAWPATGVFHSGFTGTSLSLDLPSGRWVVLLTNDVHFGRQRGLINDLRRAVNTALAP